MTHTPGPWKPHQYYEAVFAKSRKICITAPQGTSADKETQANCKLIAAAPDLLKALEDIIAYEERGRERGEPRISETWYNQCKDAVDKAKGAN